VAQANRDREGEKGMRREGKMKRRESIVGGEHTRYG
jgi:hypothetical protein